MSSAMWMATALAWTVCGQVENPVETTVSANEIGVKLELKRQLVRVAAKDGLTVVAVEMRVGRYPLDTDVENIRESCARLPEPRRYQHAECLVIEEVDRRRQGDVVGRSLLYEAGYSRDKAIWRLSRAGVAESVRSDLVPFTGMRLAHVATWDDYLCVTHVLVSEDSTFPWTFYLKRVSDRFWLTEELEFGHIIGSILGNYWRKHPDVLNVPPVEAAAFRISVDSEAPFEKHRLIVRIHDRDAQPDPHSLMLYVRRAAEPKVRNLFKGDKQALGSRGATLRDALSPYLNGTPSIEELVDAWAPGIQDNVRSNLRELQRCEQRLGMFLQLGSRLEDLALVARVETEGGEVCYVRTLDRDGEARIRPIVRRIVNGELKLDYQLPNSAASKILTNRDVAAAIARTGVREP